MTAAGWSVIFQFQGPVPLSPGKTEAERCREFFSQSEHYDADAVKIKSVFEVDDDPEYQDEDVLVWYEGPAVATFLMLCDLWDPQEALAILGDDSVTVALARDLVKEDD